MLEASVGKIPHQILPRERAGHTSVGYRRVLSLGLQCRVERPLALNKRLVIICHIILVSYLLNGNQGCLRLRDVR